jgi:hypothetical protein
MAIRSLKTEKQSSIVVKKDSSISVSYVKDALEFYVDANDPSSYPGSGSTWFDISGNNRNGTIVNSPTWNSKGYFTFNGTSQYVDFGNILNPGTSSWSVSVLMAPSSFFSTGNRFIVSKALAAAGSFRWALGTLVDTNRIRFFTEGTNVNVVDLSASTGAPINKWAFTTAVLNRSGDMSIYRDGLFFGSSSIAAFNGANYSTTHPFRIASYTDANNTTPILFFPGSIGLVMVHFKALSAAEIQQNFNAFSNRIPL